MVQPGKEWIRKLETQNPRSIEDDQNLCIPQHCQLSGIDPVCPILPSMVHSGGGWDGWILSLAIGHILIYLNINLPLQTLPKYYLKLPLQILPKP